LREERDGGRKRLSSATYLFCRELFVFEPGPHHRHDAQALQSVVKRDEGREGGRKGGRKK
jgi:hypothetical protein